MSSFPNVQSQSFVSANTYVSARTFVSAANVDAGNITATRAINASNANITGKYFIGNGELLTGISSSSYANSNVAAYLPTYTGALSGSTVSASGNIRGSYFVGNGSQLTGLSTTYSNVNVAAYLPTYTSTLSPSTVTAAGNITGGNLLTAGTISSGGNVTGVYFIGNGALLTGISSGSNTSYNNSNVAAYLPIYPGALAGSNIVVTGNAVGGNILTAGVVSATGAVFGSVFVGNGSQLSGINAGTAGTAGTVTTAAQPNITSVGTLTSLVVTSNITGGNITAAGTISTTGTVIGDSVVATNLNVGNAVSISGNLQANYLRTTGSISAAGNIAAQNLAITGAFAPATVSASGNVFAGNIGTAGAISAAGVVIGSTVNSPNVIATNLTVGNINGIPYVATSGPAFIATQTVGQSMSVSPTTISLLSLVYNNISKNIGNGYNSTTGVFTAPVAGFYQVNASAVAAPLTIPVPSTFYGAGAIILYRGTTGVVSGPFIEARSLIIGPSISTVIESSNVSTLVYLGVGETLQCKLGYITNASNLIAYGNLIPSYFSACWLRA